MLLSALTGVLLAGLQPSDAAAQAGVMHVENAVAVPRGALRLRVAPSWARWDSRFTGSGSATEPLGAVLTSDALGTTELPALTTLEAALRTLTGNPDLRLSLGATNAFSSIRVATTPISLEFGVTRRLSVGVTVPIVQRHRELLIDVAAEGAAAGNVGPTPGSGDPAVHARALQLAQELERAADALTRRIQECTGASSASGCDAIRADPAGAATAASEALQLAASVRYVYGTSAADAGVGLVPHVNLGESIRQRLEALNARFLTFIGSAALTSTVPPRGAAGAAAVADLRTLARSGAADIGPDSLGRISTLGIGDVEIGARVLLLDTRPAVARGATGAAAGPRLRVLVGALARLATGEPPIDDELFSIGAGDGQTDAEGSIAADIESGGRVGATMLVRYTAQLGDVAATRIPDERGRLSPFTARGVGTRTLGNVVALEVSPRYWVGRSFHLSAHYGLLSRGADTYRFESAEVIDPPLLPAAAPLPRTASAGGFTEQRVGFGVTYSTVGEWERGRVRLPVEVSYAHLETVGGNSALVPRAGRDQIQVRVYYRLLR